MLTTEGLFIRSQSGGSKGGRGTFWNFRRIIRVHTYVNWGKGGLAEGSGRWEQRPRGGAGSCLWGWEVTGPSSSFCSVGFVNTV